MHAGDGQNEADGDETDGGGGVQRIKPRQPLLQETEIAAEIPHLGAIDLHQQQAGEDEEQIDEVDPVDPLQRQAEDGPCRCAMKCLINTP